MISFSPLRRHVRRALASLAALVSTGMADPAGAMRGRDVEPVETAAARPAGEPLMAIVSLANQRITIYDAEGWILKAPISSGQSGYETPAGVYSILQKEAEHTSNLYDDASMPFMQRITWSGLALHAGALPGYPASHGCVRMPYEFAEQFFEMTKIGMRVIVARNEVRPSEIDHPMLFKPKSIGADVEAQATAGATDAPLLTLQSIAAARLAAARAAAKKADTARLAAARMTGEAARLLPSAESAKARADAQLAAAENMLGAASSPTGIELAEEAKARALTRRADAEARLTAARAEAPLKAEAAARAREEVKAAEAEKDAALDASREATRLLSPASIFISRKTQRLYVRQAFQQVLESPITFRDADRPIGTHIYTALGYKNGGADVRWSAVSISGAEPLAGAALDRIDIPRDVIDRISEVILPGSSLIVSDEAMSAETGKDTDFVILMTGEPHGGIKIRRHNPQARNRYDGQYGGPYGRAPTYAPPFYSGGPFDRW